MQKKVTSPSSEISDTLGDLRSQSRDFAAQMTSFRATTDGLIKAFEEVWFRVTLVALLLLFFCLFQFQGFYVAWFSLK